VPLKEVASFEIEPGVFTIHHYDGRRSINITADVDKGIVSPVEINARIEPRVGEIVANFPGYSVKFGGEAEETNKAFGELFAAFGFGILLIYIILATQFKSFLQPVMIMTIIPAAGFGVIFGLLVSMVFGGAAIFSIPVMVGVIALAGVVVNDSLVLVEFINRRRRAGMGRWSSILQGCMIRVRPIILTSVTTIGGLLPMALGISGRSTVWGPLASAIAWGLAFSTLLTLVLIPCIYAIFDDLRLLVLRRFYGQARRLHERLPLDRRE
jgi:HAE1 family hydrophobic/amphiphilic exporter-1